MKKVCVFCGAMDGKGETYLKLAKELGEKLVQNDMALVYGGASIGVMGTLADSVIENKGKAYGIIPQSLMNWELGHKGLTEIKIVETMHERKEKMYELSDAFVTIPGGIGTLDKLCEMVTWAQLFCHQKDVYLINHNGFFNGLIDHFKYLVREKFLSEEHLSIIQIVSTVDEFFSHLNHNFK